jgi:multiple sugar transport system permease protein
VEEVGVLLPADGGVHPVHAVPVLLDGGDRVPPGPELYATWRQPNAAPLWTLHPTLEHLKGLLQTTAFPTWLWNTMLIAIVSTIISLICGMFAGYALARLQLPRLGVPRHRDLHHLPGAADAALHPARRHHPRPAARQHAVGADAHLSDVPDPVLHLAADGLLQDHPEGAGGMRAHRRRDALRRHGAHHLPGRDPGILSAGIFAFTLSWNEFIYALVFMASADQKTVPVGVVSS